MPIKFEKVFFRYNKYTDQYIFQDFNLEIPKHKMIAIVGKTGCGKTTLMQHLNGLLKPTTGKVIVDDFTIEPKIKNKSLKLLRKHVGLVFQFSENQLFEETVGKDIAFGPKNFNVEDSLLPQIIHDSLKAVGLDESFIDRSCFELSGGQKRRVAVAGILAMQPDMLILDEPTAGLDPQGAVEMMNLFKNIQKTESKTIIVVTHDYDQVYEYFDEVIYLDEGQLKYQGDVNTFFEQHPKIEQPKILVLKKMLLDKGINISKQARSIEAILKEVKDVNTR